MKEEVTVHDDGLDIADGDRVDNRCRQIVQRLVGRRIDIEKDNVRAFAGLETPNLVVETKCPCAIDREHLEQIS